jgi:hypothetical protein
VDRKAGRATRRISGCVMWPGSSAHTDKSGVQATMYGMHRDHEWDSVIYICEMED